MPSLVHQIENLSAGITNLKALKDKKWRNCFNLEWRNHVHDSHPMFIYQGSDELWKFIVSRAWNVIKIPMEWLPRRSSPLPFHSVFHVKQFLNYKRDRRNWLDSIGRVPKPDVMELPTSKYQYRNRPWLSMKKCFRYEIF